MASQYPHGHSYDLFVSYSTRDLEWVRTFQGDLVADVNRFAEPDVFPFFDKARCEWDEGQAEVHLFGSVLTRGSMGVRFQ